MNVFSTPPQPSTGQQRPPPPPPAGPQQLLSPSSPAVFLACDTRQFPVFVPSPSTHSSDMPDASELAAGAAKYPHFVLNFMVQMEYMFGKPHSPLPPLKGLLVPDSSQTCELHDMARMTGKRLVEVLMPRHPIRGSAWSGMLRHIVRIVRNYMLQHSLSGPPQIIYMTNDIALVGQEEFRDREDATQIIRAFGAAVAEVLKGDANNPPTIHILCLQVSRYPGHLLANSHALFFPALCAEMGRAKGFTCSFALAQNSALHVEAEARKICWHMLRPMPCRMSFPAVGSSRVVFWAQLHQPVLPVGVAGGGLHHGMVQPHIMGAMLAKNLSPMFVTGEALVVTPLGAMPTEWKTPPHIGEIFASAEARLENTAAFMGLIKSLVKQDMLLLFRVKRYISAKDGHFLWDHWALVPQAPVQPYPGHGHGHGNANEKSGYDGDGDGAGADTGTGGGGTRTGTGTGGKAGLMKTGHFLAIHLVDREDVLMSEPPTLDDTVLQRDDFGVYENFFDSCLAGLEKMKRFNPAEYSSGRFESRVADILRQAKTDPDPASGPV